MSTSVKSPPVLENASPEERAILEDRLNAIVDAHKDLHHREKISINNTPFWIRPNVFNPTKGRASLMLLPFLQFTHEESVLDMGCGMGTYSVVSALHGAKHVVALDSNPYAVACARENVALHSLGENVEVRESNLFSSLGDDEKFDVIVSNPPFFCPAHERLPKGYIEQCFIDTDGKFMHGLLAGARKHLKKNGKICMVYGKSGMVEELQALIRTYHFSCSILATKESAPDKFYVLELRTTV